ncbi:hypothetical protein Patl1_19888 [Pistacia atlantica]|uniref:Uncharacterized protein n=1 Tax=Pistacia atlantica TaxID=434234 RepID=A0ACC1BNI9_9ROSI|nr:hypothetical protein Patl1_19888 [Pistacia atlantica]
MSFNVANVLLLESSVSVGFSYTNNSNDLLEIGDQVVANDTLAFLLGWFKRFPDFKSNDFYIIGESYGAFFDAFSGIDIFNIYYPVCVLNFSATTNSSNLEDYQFEIPSTFDPCVNNYVRKYFNQKEVQRALHANVTNLPYPYTLCSGDADARIPVTSTRYSVNKLGLPVMEEWRPWFYKHQVAGWVETYDKGLTLTTIRGGGHQAVLSARDWSLSLVTHFLSNTSLPSSSF